MQAIITFGPITQICFDGCDKHITAEQAGSSDYSTKFHADGSFTVFTPRHEYSSTACLEVDQASLPRDEDGELITEGLFCTTGFRGELHFWDIA